MNRNLTVNKRIYKVVLFILKVQPAFVAFIYAVHPFLRFFHADWSPVAQLAHLSILNIIPFYIFSYLFHFCECHRLFLHYITVNELISMYDRCWGICIREDVRFGIHCLLILITVVNLITYSYVNSHKKNTLAAD